MRGEGGGPYCCYLVGEGGHGVGSRRGPEQPQQGTGTVGEARGEGARGRLSSGALAEAVSGGGRTETSSMLESALYSGIRHE